jgi:hypothetical protein
MSGRLTANSINVVTIAPTSGLNHIKMATISAYILGGFQRSILMKQYEFIISIVRACDDRISRTYELKRTRNHGHRKAIKSGNQKRLNILLFIQAQMRWIVS